VISESDIEDKKIQELIAKVKNEKFGEAFNKMDLKIVKSKQNIKDGLYIREEI